MSNSILIHIADRALNRPLLITPEKASVIMSVLAGRIGVDASALGPDASRFVGSNYPTDETGRERFTPFKATRDGVGIITIAGSLVNRGAWIGASSGLVSYEGIKFQLQSAMNDPGTHSVILDLSSPGGEAIGAFETAEMVRQLAAKKRTVAVVNGMACSAAYAIASGANEIVTTETGVSGSIGVVLLHADYSEALAGEGIKPTLIFAGAHKVDGNPFEPLSKAVKADMQAEIDAFYQQFLATVAKGRGARTTAEAARKTEARTFIGADAVKAGLADRVGTFESVLKDLIKNPKSSKSPKGNRTMEDDSTRVAAADERARIAAILKSPEAAGREAQAQMLALDTDMTPDQASKLLSTFPKKSAGLTFAERQANNPANFIGQAPDFGSGSLVDRAKARNGA